MEMSLSNLIKPFAKHKRLIDRLGHTGDLQRMQQCRRQLNTARRVKLQQIRTWENRMVVPEGGRGQSDSGHPGRHKVFFNLSRSSSQQ